MLPRGPAPAAAVARGWTSYVATLFHASPDALRIRVGPTGGDGERAAEASVELDLAAAALVAGSAAPGQSDALGLVRLAALEDEEAEAQRKLRDRRLLDEQGFDHRQQQVEQLLASRP